MIYASAPPLARPLTDGRGGREGGVSYSISLVWAARVRTERDPSSQSKCSNMLWTAGVPDVTGAPLGHALGGIPAALTDSDLAHAGWAPPASGRIRPLCRHLLTHA